MSDSFAAPTVAALILPDMRLPESSLHHLVTHEVLQLLSLPVDCQQGSPRTNTPACGPVCFSLEILVATANWLVTVAQRTSCRPACWLV